jgi:serine protease AprX
MIRLILILILISFVLAVNGQVVNKIDVKLLNANVDANQGIVIVMKDQADISAVKNIKGKDAKATFVYNSLLAKANETQTSLIQWLKSRNITYRSFYIVNMIAAQANLKTIAQIASRDDVKEVIQDGDFKMLDMPEPDRSQEGKRVPIWNITHIGAPSVWAMGYSGQNVVIGGQDTGYAWEVTTIKSKYRGWNGTTVDHNYNWHDAIHGDNPMSGGTNSCGFDSAIPCDDNNHGTHTMGTMVGDVDDMGKEIGVAPGAKWIGCRNMENGYGTLTTYVECFEWFLAPYPVAGGVGDPTKMPHVINNSWGCPTDEGCNVSNFATMETALNNLRNAGCVIVVSAGNSGSACNTVNDPAAIFSGSFSVGATNSADVIAGFSSRGAVSVDNSYRLKPNISAPGVDIRSCRKDGSFVNWNGTSMAGPHVAGLVALLISANPALAGEVDKIEDIIEQTAINLTTSTQTCDGVSGTSIPNNTYGYGRINAISAVNIAIASNYTPYVNYPSSIVISNHQRGLILVSANNLQYRLQVNNVGQLVVTPTATHSTNSMLIHNASLNMETTAAKVILRSPNNNYWQLNINNSGQLSTQLMGILPPRAELSSGDLKITMGQKGILLRSDDGTCFLTNISNNGTILTIPAICIN